MDLISITDKIKNTFLDTLFQDPKNIKSQFETKHLNLDCLKTPIKRENNIIFYKIKSFKYLLKKFIGYTSKFFISSKDKTNEIGTDEYTNDILISFLLEFLGHSDKIAKIYSFFVSNTIGYAIIDDRENLVEYINSLEIETINVDFETKKFSILDLSRESIENIVLKVFSNLSILKKNYNFRGNRITIDNIFVEENKKRSKNNFSFLFSNLSFAEISFKKDEKEYHIFKQGEINIQPVFIESDNFYKVNSWTSFRVIDKSEEKIPEEWDYVTFIISLMLNSKIFYKILSDLKLKKLLLNTVFHPEDVNFLMERIHKKISKKINYELMLEVVGGIRFYKGFHKKIIETLK